MLIHQLRASLLPGDRATVTDGQLLTRFVTVRDEAAFAALVRRHGPMVWGVCRRVLQRPQDAEDAFQATLLVLVRKAASVVPRELVANWLYGVAHQTARKARAILARRGIRERQVAEMPEPAVTDQALWRDIRPVLDQELSRLPERYRAAIVLCDLEGKTRKEVARQLGMPEGTLSGWLTRGRSMLAKRLARHGFAVSGGAVATLLTQSAASASVPLAVMSTTIDVATATIAGNAAAGLISVNVVTLTEGVIKAMLLSKLKVLAAVLVVLTTIGAGAGMVAQDGGAESRRAGSPEKQTSSNRQLEQASAELEAARANAKQAEANLEQARAQVQQAEAVLAAARARVVNLETTYARSSERAKRSDAKAEANVLAALGSRFKYRVPFELGVSEQHEGGRIEILEVLGTRPKIEVGGQYLVRGKYVVPRGQRAKIYFYATATGPWGEGVIADLDLQRADLEGETGEFTLVHGMAGNGYFHLHLSAAERYSRVFADVYFGTGENVYRSK